MPPRKVWDAALRLKKADDREGVERNTLMIQAGLGHGKQKAQQLLDDVRELYKHVLSINAS